MLVNMPSLRAMLEEKDDTYLYCSSADVRFYSIDVHLTESDKINFRAVIHRLVEYYMSEDEEDD